MTSQDILTKLKEYVTERAGCVKAQRPTPTQGEPDSYEYVHDSGELWAFKQIRRQRNDSG